jgi:hypothetical protein
LILGGIGVSGALWQYSGMGNKGTSKREVKKPKKKKPAREDANQAAYRVVRESTR